MTEQSLDNVDVEPLKHLKDVWIEHDEKDVREYEVTFVCFLSLSSLCEVRKDANILSRVVADFLPQESLFQRNPNQETSDGNPSQTI